MKILGIGVDIIQNNRIKNSIKNHKFRDRIYSTNELKLSASSKNKIELDCRILDVVSGEFLNLG